MIKTVLQLKKNENNIPVFSQPLEKDFDYEIGNVFEYTNLIFNKLSDIEKQHFKNFGLEKGYFRIQNKWIDYSADSEIVYFEMFAL